MAVLAVLAVLDCSSAARATETRQIAEGTAVTADSVRIWYRKVGDRGPIVIAPFALFHGQSLDAIADAGYTVVTYDPRGRGRSQAVAPDRVSLTTLLLDFDAVRRAVGGEQVAAIAWSGSGMELFVYALRYPGRITRLVQLAPVAPRFVPYGARMMNDRTRRTDTLALRALQESASGSGGRNSESYCRAEARLTSPALLHDPASVTLLPDVCRFANEYPGRLAPYFGALFRSIDGYDWRDSLAKVTIPRLVIHGGSDNTPVEGNREWVAGQVNARMVVIERAGHWPQYEQPAATRDAIVRFLRGEWPSAAASGAHSEQVADDRIRDVAQRVTELDRRRQLPSASLATVDSLLAHYSDSVVYEHPGVGAIVRGKAALRAGMARYLGSVASLAADIPRITVGPGVAIIETAAGPDPRDRSRPVPATRRAIRVLEFDARGLIRRIIDYPW